MDTVDALKEIALGMRIYQSDHGNAYPTNFDLITNYLGTTELHGNIGVDTFEFINMGLVNDQYPQMLTMRERVPRQTPDGKWERVYAQMDGAVINAIPDDGNFDAWEQQHQQQYGLPLNQ
jgi:hypothetical protein